MLEKESITIPIATVCSMNFLHGTAVLIASTIMHATPRSRFRFLIIDQDLNPESRVQLEETVSAAGVGHSIEFYPISSITGIDLLKENLVGLRLNKKILPFYAKLLCGNLDRRLKKLIFLDSDILVKRNLTELFEKPCPAINAVEDDYYRQHIEDPKINIQFSIAGLDHKAPYFNSGVFLLNLQHWREQKIFEKLAASMRILKIYQQTHPNGLFSDQTFFNIVYHRNWIKLKGHWNRQCPAGLGIHHEIERGDLCLFHFIDNPKPWKMPHGRATREFFLYLDKTAYKGFRPPKFKTKIHNRLSWLKYHVDRLLQSIFRSR